MLSTGAILHTSSAALGEPVALEVAAASIWTLLIGDIDPVSSPMLVDAGRHALLFGFLGVLTAGLTRRLPTAFIDLRDRGVAATRVAYRWTWRLIVPTASSASPVRWRDALAN